MKAEIGRSSWTLLHSIAALFPRVPSEQYMRDLEAWLRLLPHVYPCEECAVGMAGYFAEFPPIVPAG